MSDNEDLLADDLGDHSLADYNIDNDEEEQLLADDYERGESQNVPTGLGASYSENESADDYQSRPIEYNNPLPPPTEYIPPETESVVPNIIVEVPNTPIVREPLPTYAPYPDEHTVPPILAPTIESPQIVPSEVPPSFPSNGEIRERFTSERPVGAQRLPQVRDIPDTLDKVVVPRGRSSTWRNPALRGRPHPYSHYPQRGHFMHRPQFPPPRGHIHRLDIRPEPPFRPQLQQERPNMAPDGFRPERPNMAPDGFRPDRPNMAPDGFRPERPNMPPDGFRPERPRMAPDGFRPERPQEGPFRPQMDRHMERPFNPNFQRFPNFRPQEPRPNFRPNFERAQFYRPFGPREVIPGHLPQVAVRPSVVLPSGPLQVKPGGRDPEVRMLPVQLPPNLPPGGLQGKKVLINPHFKGNFQPPDGPIKDIDDAAERFIAEQRNALARAAGRQLRRSPQRYIENTTIEIENDLARPPPPKHEDDLLRRQEEFINANRAGLRRRMRSPPAAAVRRSPDRRRPRTRSRTPPGDKNDEDSEYRRRLREQESLRERVLRAKEVRRRKNAVALITREREQQEKDKDKEQLRERDRERPKSPREEKRPLLEKPKSPLLEKPKSPELVKPDTTKKSPEKEIKREEKSERERSPVKKESEVNSTCESLTPPRPSSGALTPPLPTPSNDDDELELILDDIDGILTDDDEEHRPETKPAKPKVSQVDLRAKLPPKSNNESKRERQKIVFTEDRKREKSPKAKSPPLPRRTIVNKTSDKTDKTEKKQKTELSTNKSRQRIIFEQNNKEPEKDKTEDSKPKFSNRRVILQRKTNQQPNKDKILIRTEKDPSQPNLGIFSRAVRTAIGTEIKNQSMKTQKISDDPQIEYESESDESKLSDTEDNLIANVSNLPHGMTDTRMKTLAGNDVQSLNMNKEERTAKIVFKTSMAAESFKKKFNNKMVAASRLTVTLR